MSERKYIVITADDRIALRDTEHNPFYGVMRSTVGGDIEHVKPRGLKHPQCMIVNENGLIIGLPTNAGASMLYGTARLIRTAFGAGIAYTGSPIVGDVASCKEGFTEEGYDIIPLEEKEAEQLFRKLRKQIPFLKEGE